ncbi:hypothetical protein PMAYCL1PPCAC_23755, partial [Pristionchus mayeri]
SNLFGLVALFTSSPPQYTMSGGGLVAAGILMAGVAFGARSILRNQAALKRGLEKIPAFDKYHRGGFEEKMSKREAALILGITQNAKPNKLKEAHKKIMIANHPDRGGSPYIAAKVNEAKQVLEKPGGN